QVRVDELVEHVRELTAAVGVPVSVDAERGYGADPDDVARTVEALANAGAAGVSIEDYDPARGPGPDGIDPVEVAVDRVAAAAHVCDQHGMVLTARAENHLYGVADLDDTIARLAAYRDAGAQVCYAPGLVSLAEIAEVVRGVGGAVNVLMMPGGPTVAQLTDAGVRRVSTGSWLTWAAYGALADAATELRDAGTSQFLARVLSPQLREGLHG
ncbi:MAG: isocitrate lyase/phosphoenolpyruvate mutase family protein, partial [Angustibacter sp.]